MKHLKLIIGSLSIGAVILAISAFSSNTESSEKNVRCSAKSEQANQLINLFVTHGHCSLPFRGNVQNLHISTSVETDEDTPFQNMEIAFEIDPSSFDAWRTHEYTERLRNPGLFTTGKKGETIAFHSTNVINMGKDWYQVNGKLSIKGVESDVKFFATRIHPSDEATYGSLIIEGQMDLYDWGIDYDKIVNGRTSEHPTKWMHLNMKVDLSQENCSYSTQSLRNRFQLNLTTDGKKKC